MCDGNAPGNSIDPDETHIAADAISTAASPGSLIGSYELMREVGRGGMGVVFLARQKAPLRRQVALKLISKNVSDTGIVRRFEAERQALALMDHPNIAKVFEAGTTAQGTPYFVMEFVNGSAITRFCDRNSLCINDRLSLFVQACAAVHHAHKKGVIHRDIKPSNVLVTESDGGPQVKVIDFGLAKALQPGTRLADTTLLTEVGQLLGTLQYMSPEQAELDPRQIDARSDEYSLGVLLYELLVGSTPIERDRIREWSLTRLIAAIREEEHESPSQRLLKGNETASQIAAQRRTSPKELLAVLRNDLDWLVMKALKKDPIQRYPSVDHLADDARRFLAGEPLKARAPSRLYRLFRATSYSLRSHPKYWLGVFLVLILVQFVVINLIGLANAGAAAELVALRALVVKAAALGGLIGLLHASIRKLWREDPFETLLLRSIAFWSIGMTAVMLSLGPLNPVRKMVEQLKQPVNRTVNSPTTAGPPSEAPFSGADPVAGEISELQELAQSSRSSGDLRRAEELYRRVVEIQKAVKGMQHPDYAHSLKDLAQVYLEMGSYSQAKTLLQYADEVLQANEQTD